MAVDKWAYDPDNCDGYPCCGDCYLCTEAEQEDFDLEEIMEEVRMW